jgi:sRNA-binding protein
MTTLKEMTPGGRPEAIREDRTTDEVSNPTPLQAKDPAALIAVFAAKWPKCFSVEEDRRRPLKLKIHFDILPAFDWNDLNAIRAALQHYVCSLPYLHALRAGAERIGLDGRPDGEVSDEEAEAAANRIKSRLDYEAEINKRLHAANADKPRLSLPGRA